MNPEDVTVKRLPCFSDGRGELFVAEAEKEIPFDVQRLFFIKNVPADEARGNHIYLHNEFVVCCVGKCKIRIGDHARETEIALSSGCSVLIPGGTWRTLYDFSADCILAVASDELYSKSDYVLERAPSFPNEQ